MRVPAEWIKKHQVLTFFVIAYAITWTGFLCVYRIFPGNEIVEALFSPIVFSPAIAAMLISAVVSPHPRLPANKSRPLAFAITWIVASLVGVLYLLKGQDINFSAPAVVFFCYYALFPAWVVSRVFARNAGIREHFSTLLRPRGPGIWYLVVFLIFPGLQLLDIWVTRLFGGQAEFTMANQGVMDALLFYLAQFLMGFLFAGGINEESGWRGFALPRLQARYPVIVSIVIVWFFWALWHIPWDIGRGVPTAQMLENRILWNLVFAILLSWLYNRSHGSILAPALLHPAMNTFGNHLGSGAATQFLFIGMAIFAVIYDRMWKKLPPDHPAVYHSPDRAAPQVAMGEAVQGAALVSSRIANE